MRGLIKTVVILAVVLAGLAGLLKWQYGGGGEFPDRHTGDPRLPESALEVVAELPTPPGNIAVSATGRVFVTLHPEAHPTWSVVELVDGRMQPWPSAEFQQAGTAPQHFRDVLSLRIDRQNRLWTLDNGRHGLFPARLLAFDLDSGTVVHEFEFPREVAGLGSHLNDFQVSPDGHWIYMADASFFGKRPALIAYDVVTGQARRLLDQHPAVLPDLYVPTVQGRRMTLFGLIAIRPGVDSIVLDRRGEWLYFAPVTDLNLYRIRAAALQNPSLDAATLAGQVEVFAPKTMTDGLTIDDAGTIYLSDLEHSAIVELRTDGSMSTLLQSGKLRWPDGFSFGTDGWLYISCSSLQHVLGRLPSSITAHAPYPVYRVRLGVAAEPGH